MKKNCVLTFFLYIFLTIIFFFPLASATLIIPSETRFSYANGTYFTHPGTFENATYIDNIWYFNNVEYTPSSSELISPTPNPYVVAAFNAVYTNMYIALGLIGISLIILACVIILRATREDSESSVIPGFILLIVTLIGLILAFVIISAFQNSVQVNTNLIFLIYYS
jgi:hypothetical protein